MTPQWACSPLGWLDRVAAGTRRIMMDFGFGTFLEKFEEHFGRIALKVLLILFAAAAAAVCINLIATLALTPAWTVIYGVYSDNESWITWFASVTYYAVLIILFSVLMANLLNAMDARRLVWRAEQVHDQSDVIHEELRAELDRAYHLHFQMRDNLKILVRVLKKGLANIDDEQSKAEMQEIIKECEKLISSEAPQLQLPPSSGAEIQP